MKPENLINAVNQIHADAGLKAKVTGGEPAVRRHKPILSTLSKPAACLAVIAVLVLGITLVPQILKPLGTTSHNSQMQGGAVSANPGQPGMVNGLYHDDAIQNILLLGVDDYQKGDLGRSDSMLLVSVDTRHKKLKITSFMRDMYVSIPGYGNNKLNAAYHFAGGGAEGAELAVKTIEANFGTDIDRYVIIGNSAFDQIVDKLGGVTMTITAGEAKLINQYSGDSRRNLTAGTFLLSGKQAHYYSRIRVIGDDFERTGRQRKIFFSIADKFKTSNITSNYSILSETLPLVTTNMSKNEVLDIAENSLTYLNYPVSQNRIPGDDNYQSEIVSGAGTVLVPDKAKNKQSIAKFIYEDNVS